jgi:hypothetical protein
MNVKMDEILVGGTHKVGWNAGLPGEQALKRKVIRKRKLA